MGKKLTPTLLDNPTTPKEYQVRIRLRGDNWVEMRSPVKQIMLDEYNRIRSQGIYGGSWVEGIEMVEL